MALNVQYITNLLGEPVEWEELVIEHGHVKELRGKFTSSVMAIRERIQ